MTSPSCGLDSPILTWFVGDILKFPFLFQLVELGTTVIYSQGIATDEDLSVSSGISKHMPVLMFLKIKNKAGNNFIVLQ